MDFWTFDGGCPVPSCMASIDRCRRMGYYLSPVQKLGTVGERRDHFDLDGLWVSLST